MLHNDKDGMAKILKEKGETVIPNGMYCYETLRPMHKEGEPYKFAVEGVCPYLDYDDEQPEQMCGYCWFLKEGDWEGEGGGLLWDSCKYCGIRDDEDFDL